MGSIDSAGNLLLTGQMGQEDVGTWTENWYVGGVPAGDLSFVVQNSPPGCDVTVSAAPPLVVSVDYLEPYDNSIQFTSTTPSMAGGSVPPSLSNLCAMYGEFISTGPSMYANLQTASGTEAAFQVSDNGFRPAYWYTGPSYYPYYDSSGVTFEAIDSHGTLYLAGVIVPLVVTWAWDY
jgi:hypothetical protein